MSEKSIIFIPPGGDFIAQDFALTRVINFFKTNNYHVVLLHCGNKQNNTKNGINTVHVNSQMEIIEYLHQNQYDFIFHRSWMHRYAFAAELSKQFDNTIVYIKDWHDFPRDIYEFVYDTVEDVDAIFTIFQFAKLVLSHYTSEYTDILASKYHIKKDKFHFFPEYSNSENFSHELKKDYALSNVKLLLGGGGTHTAVPDVIIPGKAFFSMLIGIANQHIYIDMVVVEKTYNKIHQNRKMYLDYLYEDQFNEYFSIKKNGDLCTSISTDYHFGMFGDSCFPPGAYYFQAESYAVTSKFAFYLELGLPVLVNKRFKALSKIVEENAIGLTFTDNDLHDFKKILDISKNTYNGLVQNIYRYREQFIYNKQTMKPILALL